MNVTSITDLDLVTTSDLISELDKRADRVIVIMETNAVDQSGMDWMFHNNGGFIRRENVIFSLMLNVKKTCL